MFSQLKQLRSGLLIGMNSLLKTNLALKMLQNSFPAVYQPGDLVTGRIWSRWETLLGLPKSWMIWFGCLLLLSKTNTTTICHNVNYVIYKYKFYLDCAFCLRHYFGSIWG